MFRRLISSLRPTLLRGEPFEVCPFPPPYQGMVAINSDVEFTSWECQLDLIGHFGRLGLETGFSFWMFADPALGWRLFEDDDRWSVEAPSALKLLRAGVLDTVHSYGDRTTFSGARIDRSRIRMALGRLADEGANVSVYTNHGGEGDKQNVGGAWGTYQEGDVPGSDFYHLDLTSAAGCRYFWTDIDYVNDCWSFPPLSVDRPGILVGQVARDGQPILRFRRYRGDLSKAPTAASFAEQMAPVLRQPPTGYLVVYQHLGCHRAADGRPIAARAPYFSREADVALEGMAEQQRAGLYLVTTTAKLLRHAALMAGQPWRLSSPHRDHVRVEFCPFNRIEGVEFPVTWDNLSGWALAVERPIKVEAILGHEHRLLPLERKGGRLYAEIPWRSLSLLDELDRINAHA